MPETVGNEALSLLTPNLNSGESTFPAIKMTLRCPLYPDILMPSTIVT